MCDLFPILVHEDVLYASVAALLFIDFYHYIANEVI
jgi:hypothetical protein